jgi:hypothetical protein
MTVEITFERDHGGLTSELVMRRLWEGTDSMKLIANWSAACADTEEWTARRLLRRPDDDTVPDFPNLQSV